MSEFQTFNNRILKNIFFISAVLNGMYGKVEPINKVFQKIYGNLLSFLRIPKLRFSQVRESNICETFAHVRECYFRSNVEIQQGNSPLNGEISISFLQNLVKKVKFP